MFLLLAHQLKTPDLSTSVTEPVVEKLVRVALLQTLRHLLEEPYLRESQLSVSSVIIACIASMM